MKAVDIFVSGNDNNNQIDLYERPYIYFSIYTYGMEWQRIEWIGMCECLAKKWQQKKRTWEAKSMHACLESIADKIDWRKSKQNYCKEQNGKLGEKRKKKKKSGNTRQRDPYISRNAFTFL